MYCMQDIEIQIVITRVVSAGATAQAPVWV